MWWQRREGWGDDSSFEHAFAMPLGQPGGCGCEERDPRWGQGQGLSPKIKAMRSDETSLEGFVD